MLRVVCGRFAALTSPFNCENKLEWINRDSFLQACSWTKQTPDNKVGKCRFFLSSRFSSMEKFAYNPQSNTPNLLHTLWSELVAVQSYLWGKLCLNGSHHLWWLRLHKLFICILAIWARIFSLLWKKRTRIRCESKHCHPTKCRTLVSVMRSAKPQSKFASFTTSHLRWFGKQRWIGIISSERFILNAVNDGSQRGRQIALPKSSNYFCTICHNIVLVRLICEIRFVILFFFPPSPFSLILLFTFLSFLPACVRSSDSLFLLFLALLPHC